jgi:uncharacterized protein YukE
MSWKRTAKSLSSVRDIEVDIGYDRNPVVDDNAQLFDAITGNVGKMMTKMMNALSDRMSEADQETLSILTRLEGEVLDGLKIQLLEMMNGMGSSYDDNHSVLMKAIRTIEFPDLGEVHGRLDGITRNHGELHSKADKLLDVLYDVKEGHGSVHGGLRDILKNLTGIEDLHNGLHSRVRSFEDRLTSIERNGREVFPALDKIMTELKDIRKDMGGHAKGLEDYDKHFQQLHFKLDSHSKTHDNIVKQFDQVASHDGIMKGVNSMIADHLGDHNGQMMKAIDKLPLPADEKVLLNAIENSLKSVESNTLESIRKLKADLTGSHDKVIGSLRGMDGFDKHFQQLHFKLDSHAKTHDSIVKQFDAVASHDGIMKGVNSMLADHLGDHNGKMMKAIDKLPLPADEKVLLNAIENSLKSVEGNTLESIKKLKADLTGSHDKMFGSFKGMLDDHSRGLHGKLDGHAKCFDNLAKQMDKMPNHDAVMKGVDGLMASHLGDHNAKMMKAIDKLPLPPDEKVLLNAIENSLEQSLGQTLEAIKKLRGDLGGNSDKIKDWLTDHHKAIQSKLDDHSKNHDNLSKQLDKHAGKQPDHGAVVKGVNDLVAGHLGDHNAKLMKAIDKLPLPPDEKVLLNAIENSLKAIETSTLEAIKKLKTDLGGNGKEIKGWLDDSSKSLHQKLDGHSKSHDNIGKQLDNMPNHDAIMKGVGGMLADHLGDHNSKMMKAIDKVPLPPDEKVLLNAIENSLKATETATLDAIKKYSSGDVKGILADHSKELHSKLDGHGKGQDALVKQMGSMANHDGIMKGVQNMLADHLGDHNGKMQKAIDKLPLPPDEKVLLNAIENSLKALEGVTLEAIKKLKAELGGDSGKIKGWLEDHSKTLHSKLDGQGKTHDNIAKQLDKMPDHASVLKATGDLLAGHLGDHNAKMMKGIDKLPLPPDEKVLLNAIENSLKATEGATLEAIKKLRSDLTGHHDKSLSTMSALLDDHSRGLHGKMEGHAKGYDSLAKQMDKMPDHGAVMKGVNDLMAGHLGDHNAKLMKAIDKLPLPADEKVLLNAIENSMEQSLGQTLDAIKKLKADLGGGSPDKIKMWLDDHSKTLHGKLDAHIGSSGKGFDNLAKQMDKMPSHDAVMKGVDSLMASHLGDHNTKMMRSIDKLPLPPDEKVLLNAIENSLEAVLGQTLEAIKKLKTDLQGHTESLHGKMGEHGKMYDKLVKQLDNMPDHDALMDGVHGLMSKHIGDHKDHLSKEISGMPLPPDEKIMLQAMENMQETVLGEMLEAIKKLKADLTGSHDKYIGSFKDMLDDHSKDLHGKLDGHGKNHDNITKQLDKMPNHDAVMKGVNDLVAGHLGDHNSKMMKAIDKLPLPADEKVLLNAIENSLKATETATLEAIKKLKSELGGSSDKVKGLLEDHARSLHGKLDGHGKSQDNFIRQLDKMPNHDGIMKGVNDLVAGHLGDHNAKMMKAIDKLPLPPDEKVLLMAIENSLKQTEGVTLESIKKLKSDLGGGSKEVKGWLDEHSRSLHGKLDSHSKSQDSLMKQLDKMPNHDGIMRGVNDLVAGHLGDHNAKMMKAIDKLPLPPDEKVLLMAIENSLKQTEGATLEAIKKLKSDLGGNSKEIKSWLDDHAKDLHGKLDGHGKNHDNIGRQLDKMPSHDAVMKGVNDLMANHLGDHNGKMMKAIDKLPLPPDEKVLLNAIENSLDQVLGQTLDAIKKLSKDVQGHTDSLHGKFGEHGKAVDDLMKQLDNMPDHDALVDSVHGLMDKHIGDHKDHMSKQIKGMPLPPDEKIMLQAIENMQETVLAETLEAMKKMKSDLQGSSDKYFSSLHAKFDDHSQALHGKMDGTGKGYDNLAKHMDKMPNHDAVMKGVNDLMAGHLGDHNAKMMKAIDKLPLPPDEKVLLNAIENSLEAALGQTLESIKKLKTDLGGNSDKVKGWLEDHSKSLHGKLDAQGKTHDMLGKRLDNLPDHRSIMKGVDDMLSSHIGDHNGKMMKAIDKLPLPPDEKVLLNAIENSMASSLTTTLESIKKLKSDLQGHTDSLHARFGEHSQNFDKMAGFLETMPDHDSLMNGVHGLLSQHMGDHGGKISSAIDQLPLPPDEKILLQAIENMEENVLTATLEAINNIQMTVNVAPMGGEISTPGARKSTPRLQERTSSIPRMGRY